MRPWDELSAEAVVIAEAIGDPATLAYALISRAMATWGPRRTFDMRVLAERAMGLAAEAGDQEHVAAARLNRAQSIFATGPPDMVRPAFEDSADGGGAEATVAPLVRGVDAHIRAPARRQAGRGRSTS